MLSFTFFDGRLTEAVFVTKTGEKKPIKHLDPCMRQKCPHPWTLHPTEGGFKSDHAATLAAGGPIFLTPSGWVRTYPTATGRDLWYWWVIQDVTDLQAYFGLDVKAIFAEEDTRDVAPKFRKIIEPGDYDPWDVSAERKETLIGNCFAAIIRSSLYCKNPIVIEAETPDAPDDLIFEDIERRAKRLVYEDPATRLKRITSVLDSSFDDI